MRDEWEATALARLIAVQVVRYRVENALTQTALGRKLGMTQPQVARIEAGEHNPGMETLRRLAHGLGWTIHIDISADAPLRVSAVA